MAEGSLRASELQATHGARGAFDQAARAIIIPHRGLIEAISAELGGKLGIATEEWLALLAKHGPLQSVELPPPPASLAIGALTTSGGQLASVARPGRATVTTPAPPWIAPSADRAGAPG